MKSFTVLCFLSLVLQIAAAGLEDGPPLVTILDASTGEGIADVRVELRGRAPWMAVTGTDGSVTLPNDLTMPIDVSLVRTGYARVDTTLVSGAGCWIISMHPRPTPMPAVKIDDIAERPGEWSSGVVSISVDPGASTVSQALDEVPGVRAAQVGTGLGAGAICIRGSSSQQTEMWLDGVPLSGARFGTAKAEGILPGVIERLHVYQGWTPPRLGGSAIGGGVELSAQSAPRAGVRARVGGGGLGRREGGVAFGSRFRSGWTWADVELLSQENDFVYTDDNTTPLNATDDTLRTRANNAIDVVNVLLKSELRLDPHQRFLFTSLGSWRREGVPGPGANPIREARHRAWEERLAVKHMADSGGGTITEITAYQEWFSSKVSDPRAELRHYPSTRTETGTSTGARLFHSRRGSSFVGQDLRIETRLERFRAETDARQSHASTQRRLTGSAGGGIEVRPVNWSRGRGELALTWFRDTDEHGGASTGDLATARLALELQPFHDVTCLLTMAMRGRQPTLLEKFGDQGSVRGNPALVSEKARQMEAILDVWDGTLRLTSYVRDAENLIHYWLRSPRVVIAENIGEVRMKGVEISVRFGGLWNDYLSVRLYGAYQETEDRSPAPYYRGKDLPGCPSWRGGGNMIFRIAQRSRVGIGVTSESSFYLDRANARAEGGRTDMRVWGELGGGSLPSLLFQVDNVLDQSGNDQWGYPLPGRRWRVGITSWF